MNYPIITDDIIYIVSDMTAGVSLIVLIGAVAVQSEKRHGPGHLLAAALFEMAGIFLRLFAEAIEQLPADFAWRQAPHFLASEAAPLIWILSFLLVTIGITEAATFVIYVNGRKGESRLRTRAAVNTVTFAVGTILFALSGNINAFSLCVIAQLVIIYIYINRICSESVMCEFGRASLPALITFIIPLFFEHVRLTGFGLSIMLWILNEQYLSHIERKLSENETELAKRKVQLLAEQISPHYIYNSLQSIRDLCVTDPERARDAIDSFSEFLRGNLESLTVEELIPFSRELELTKAYLELEKLTGRGMFEVDYQLEITDFMLPPLVLQPVVENAVKHGAVRAASGMESGEAGVTDITIATRKSGGYICIEVTDRTEGGGSAAAAGVALAGADSYLQTEAPEISGIKGKKKSVGLGNVRTRVAIQSGGTLDLESTSNGTRVTILLQFIPNGYTTAKP